LLVRAALPDMPGKKNCTGGGGDPAEKDLNKNTGIRKKKEISRNQKGFEGEKRVGRRGDEDKPRQREAEKKGKSHRNTGTPEEKGMFLEGGVKK